MAPLASMSPLQGVVGDQSQRCQFVLILETAALTLSLVKVSSCFIASLVGSIITEMATKEHPMDPIRQTSWCPTFQVGTQCPENSLIFFYKCCGHLHKECCSHLRVWVLVLIIALPLLLVVPPLIYLLRRLLWKGHRRYAAGIQMRSRDTRESRSVAM